MREIYWDDLHLQKQSKCKLGGLKAAVIKS